MPPEETALLIFRCDRCGDTFSLHETDEVVCPTCGGTEARLAHEPLL